MTNNLLAGLIITLFGIGLAYFKYYIDAKIDPINKRIDDLRVELKDLLRSEIKRLEQALEKNH